MPKYILHSSSYNNTLYVDLLRLLKSWPDVFNNGEKGQRAEELALDIARQSYVAMEIEKQKISRGSNATERKKAVTRILNGLKKVRTIWSTLENEDQKSLASCMEYIKLMEKPGHQLIENISYEQILTIYNNDYPISAWRKEELSRHRSWGIDIEMLDLLITNTEMWLSKKAPAAQQRLDPAQYAVRYLASACEAYGLKASHSDNSRFMRVVTMYLNYTYPDRKNSLVPRDMIKNANSLRRADPLESYFSALADDDNL
ncbi:MAG: hypothetical protein CMK74_11740 [Pseudomonadales bacterium]|jgi:hypothetical protein|nr:hypothetical protein [Pseudomonadales bacterium]|tara:strand:- start:109 stop:882 length:774 start_codon:yes stop_codon:yes gene_type:complete